MPFLRRKSTTRPAKAKKKPPLKLADFPWRKIAIIALALGAVAALVYSKVDIEQVHARAAEINGVFAFALLLFLPLLGLPANLLHIAAGIRFGAPLGMLLVSLSIGFQLLASYGIVRLWRKRFVQAKWVKKVRERIPDGAHASVCVFAVLLPGAPYAGINYVLPLVGVPLRTMLCFAWPLHTLRSTVTVLLGDQSAHLTATRLVVLMAYALMILGASWWTYRRLQSQFEGRPPAANGRTQPA